MIWQCWWAWTQLEFFGVPRFHFHYDLFTFVNPLPVPGMIAVIGLMLLSTICVAIGFMFRLAAWTFFFTHTYIFLLDSTHYNNHYYLICWLAFLLAIGNSHRWLSVDRKLKRKGTEYDTVPLWELWIVRAMLFFVYFFGGIAKINADWLKGEPIRQWLIDLATATPALGWMHNEPLVYFLSLGGTYFDLFIIPMILWKPSRALGFVLLILFHLNNAFMFDIGIFPPLGIGSAIIFVSSDTIRRWWQHLRLKLNAQAEHSAPALKTAPVDPRDKPLIVSFLALFIAFNLFMPFRHLLYGGDTSWTEEGMICAWRMKLRDKRGDVAFRVADPITRRVFDAKPEAELTKDQYWRMACDPQHLLEYAHHLRRLGFAAGLSSVTVQASAIFSLNSRLPQPMIDDAADLGELQRNVFEHSWWIVPMTTPLLNPHPQTSDCLIGAAAAASLLGLAASAACLYGNRRRFERSDDTADGESGEAETPVENKPLLFYVICINVLLVILLAYMSTRGNELIAVGIFIGVLMSAFGLRVACLLKRMRGCARITDAAYFLLAALSTIFILQALTLNTAQF